MFDEIEQCFLRAHHDSQVRAIVLSGNPESRHFTAGLDCMLLFTDMITYLLNDSVQEQPLIGNQELEAKDVARKALWFRELVKVYRYYKVTIMLL